MGSKIVIGPVARKEEKESKLLDFEKKISIRRSE